MSLLKVMSALSKSSGGASKPHVGIAKPIRIKWFGDSIVVGGNSSNNATKSYAALTCIYYGAINTNLAVGGTVVNPADGFNGSVGPNFIDTYVSANDGNTGAGNYIFAAYGTNDYSGGYGAFNPAPWIAAYDSILHSIMAFGYKANQIIIGTAPYQSARNSPPFVAALNTMCATNGYIFFDGYTFTQGQGGDSLLADGIHMLDIGHQIYANGLIAKIESLL